MNHDQRLELALAHAHRVTDEYHRLEAICERDRTQKALDDVGAAARQWREAWNAVDRIALTEQWD